MPRLLQETLWLGHAGQKNRAHSEDESRKVVWSKVEIGSALATAARPSKPASSKPGAGRMAVTVNSLRVSVPSYRRIRTTSSTIAASSIHGTGVQNLLNAERNGCAEVSGIASATIRKFSFEEED
jgi:hypothetical protein